MDIPYSIHIHATATFPTPNYMQKILADLNLVDICCRFVQDGAPSLLVKIWHQIRAALTHSIRFCLHGLQHHHRGRESSEHVTTLCSTAQLHSTTLYTRNVQLGTPWYKGVILSVPLYIFLSKWLKYQDWSESWHCVYVWYETIRSHKFNCLILMSLILIFWRLVC